jgi:hypothetical protein
VLPQSGNKTLLISLEQLPVGAEWHSTTNQDWLLRVPAESTETIQIRWKQWGLPKADRALIDELK